MKNLRYLLAFPTLMLAASCAHTDESLTTCPGSCTTVAGRLVSSNGQAGIAGATVTIAWHGGYGLVGGVTHTKATVTTDNGGYYRATFFLRNAELPDSTAQGYFDATFAVNNQQFFTRGVEALLLPRLKRDTTIQTPDYLIPRKAFVNLTLRNQSQLPGPVTVSFVSALGTPPTAGLAWADNAGLYLSDQLPGLNPIAVPADQPLVFALYGPPHVPPLRAPETLTIPAGTTRTLTATY